jgi:hypothetical protein
MDSLYQDIDTLNNALEYIKIPLISLKAIDSGDFIFLISGGKKEFNIEGFLKGQIPFILKCSSLSMQKDSLALGGNMRLYSSILPGNMNSHSMQIKGALTMPQIKHDYSGFINLLTPMLFNSFSGQHKSPAPDKNDQDSKQPQKEKINPVNILMQLFNK